MNQLGRGRKKEIDMQGKTLKALQLLDKDIIKYSSTKQKNIQTYNMATSHKSTQKQTSSSSSKYSQSPVSSSLHVPSSSFSSKQSHKHTPPSASLQHRLSSILSQSPSVATQSFTGNVPSLQHKQTLSRSSSPSIQSFTQNIQPSFKPLTQQTNNKQTLSCSSSQPFIQNNPSFKPSSQQTNSKQTSGPIQCNHRPSPARVEDKGISHGIMQSLK